MTKTQTARPTYEVDVRRSGDWWAIRVPGIEGAFSQARRLEQVEFTARDLISLMLEVPTDSFDLNTQVELPHEAEDAVRYVTKARGQLVDAQEAFTIAARTAAKTLTETLGLTVRDAGRILGVSHQRVDQLLHGR